MQIEPKLLKYSKNLRQNRNPWEAKLWYYLRAHRFYGLKFKRQFVIGGYIVDFYCHDRKLVIELDGGQHSQARRYDSARDRYLIEKGNKVLRFWNNDVDHPLLEGEGIPRPQSNSIRIY
ncbi:MAG: DUF559 domain-containing protein [Candidatus Doudnabacteria bacterium]|nr:DUF559 domain-containing protein [Candidatus Doudnabacteria bacterium]